MAKRREIVIVGGGVIGLTTAATLLQRSPDISVTVLERDAVGLGATGFAGAVDIPFYKNETHRRMIEVSWAWHAARQARAAAYRLPVPTTWFAEPGEIADSLKGCVLDSLALDAAPSDWAPPGAERFRGKGFVVDCAAWCQDLVREISESGRGSVLENTEVADIDDVGSTTIVRCVDGREYSGEHVVVALGPWFPAWNELTASWSRARGLKTKRVFGLNIAAEQGPRGIYGWLAGDMFFHPTVRAGDFRMSFRRDTWDVHPDNRTDAKIGDLRLDAEMRFLDGLLGAGNWAVSGERVHVDSYTPEFTPIIDSCEALGRNVTVATGTHGSGIRLAPGIADIVATRLLVSLDLPEAFRANR
ncbi:MAG: FAD-dependent oxidoreductase [Gemmatimonadaceae bacterium]